MTRVGSGRYNQRSGNLINRVISGGRSLTKLDTGKLTLTGASAYTGASMVNAGTLKIDTGGSLSGRDNIGVGAGATLAISRTAASAWAATTRASPPVADRTWPSPARQCADC